MLSNQQKIDKIFSQLPPMIDDFVIDSEHHTFSTGQFYIQHIPEILEKAQREFLELCYQITENKIYLSEKVHRQGIVGRYLDDSGIKILYHNWHRFMCIDEQYREWGQPYFAINQNEQEKAKDKQSLNLLLPELRQYFLNHMRDEKLNEILDK